MNSVIFFTQNGWAFGQIHHGLIKNLFPHRIYANLLNWEGSYSYEEYNFLNKSYRLFVTQPDGVNTLLSAGIPAGKIIAIAHHENDLRHALNNPNGQQQLESIRELAVVNPNMIEICANLGIKRIPRFVRVGIDANHYRANLSNELKIVGYAGAKTFPHSDGTNCKRGYLIDQILRDQPVTIKCHQSYNHLAMPGYYQSLDALLVTSSYESVGLPAMEAACAGRMVFGGSVGYVDLQLDELDQPTGTISYAVNDEGFVADLRREINWYCRNPSHYRRECRRYQANALRRFDWSRSIQDWVNLLD